MRLGWLGIMLLAAVGCAPATNDGARAPESDIWSVSFVEDDGAITLGAPTNLTDREGYDNQPCLLSDGSGFLYSSHDGTQADVWRYDFATGQAAPLTQTAESEYSPQPIPGDDGFSVVRVEEDGDRRLWRFDADGSNPQLLIEWEDSVEYSSWIDAKLVAIRVGGNPNELKFADPSIGWVEAEPLAYQVGRTFGPVPGNNAFTFVQFVSDEEWWVRQVDLLTRETFGIIKAPKDVQDFVWTPGGTLLMARDATLLRYRPTVDEDWVEVADLSSSVEAVTRLELDVAGNRLLFAARRSGTEEERSGEWKDPLEILGASAYDALETMVRELLSRRPGGHLIEADLRELDLEFALRLDGSDADRRAFARELAAHIGRRLDDLVQHAAAFRPGQAWCHRCDDATCVHSMPPSCRHVFVGYATTGTPRWIDFGQYCLDIKHPRVDALYADPPVFITMVHSREELHRGMLDAFDRATYELLGAVTAGFYRIRSRTEEGRGVMALTVQAAASRASDGRLRLGLNLIGRAPSGDDLSSLWERHSELPWRRAVLWAQTALSTVPTRRGRRSGRGEDPIEERVESILRGLARRLDRDSRARARRTRHAEARHESGRRPTGKAVDDARAVRLDQCFVDERSGTLVVLGERGRTHFFTTQGRHVSSVRYSKEAIARKVKLEVWREATDDERDALLDSLAGVGSQS